MAMRFGGAGSTKRDANHRLASTISTTGAMIFASSRNSAAEISRSRAPKMASIFCFLARNATPLSPAGQSPS
ncbi:MAG TPA: hypothetical protein VF051_06375, partial [Hyphomicrobiaceae bacterium]